MISVFDQSHLGGLFGDPELREILSEDANLARCLNIEATYALCLGQTGVVSEDISKRAKSAIEEAQIISDSLHHASGVDGMIIPDLIRQIRSQTDECLHPAIHTGLTSQDVLDTALVLGLKQVTTLLSRRVEAVGQALSGLHMSFGQNELMGYTRMQAALPITVGNRIDAWGMPFDDHQQRLTELKPRLLRLQFGGPVGLRNMPQANELNEAMANALNLAPSSKAWHAMRDGLGEFASWLSLVTGTLGKMGQDIALMAQLRDITLSGGGASSAMSHKKNPVKAELLVTLAAFNATQLSGMHHALRHEQERSGAMWALEWMILPQMIMATGLALKSARTLLGQIETIGQAD